MSPIWSSTLSPYASKYLSCTIRRSGQRCLLARKSTIVSTLCGRCLVACFQSNSEECEKTLSALALVALVDNHLAAMTPSLQNNFMLSF